MNITIINEITKKIKLDGYAILKNAISQEVTNKILSFVKNYQYTTLEKNLIEKSNMKMNSYAHNVFNIALKKPGYLKYFIRGAQGEIAKNLLNDNYYASIPKEFPNYILRGMLARSSINEMPFHIDSFIPYTGNFTSVIQMVLFLEKSNLSNGCTKVVKGSHLSGEYAGQINEKVDYVECDPGDMVIWDSRLWHATTKNNSENTRWALICTFSRWYIKQGYDYPRAMSKNAYKKLDVDERIVFGYASTVPLNELDRTEVKGPIDLVLDSKQKDN